MVGVHRYLVFAIDFQECRVSLDYLMSEQSAVILSFEYPHTPTMPTMPIGFNS